MTTVSVKSSLGRASRDLERLLHSAIDDSIKKGSEEVVKEARRTHRYKRRTGRLERAVRSKVAKSVATAYVSDAVAPYGYYVHEGFRSWSSDRFLYEAAKKKSPHIRKDMKEAIDVAIRKSGLKG